MAAPGKSNDGGDVTAGSTRRGDSALARALAGPLLALCLMAPTPDPATAAKRADLLVTAVSKPPASLAPGAALRIVDATVNRGQKRASRSVTGHFLSRDRKFGRGDLALGKGRAVKALGARKSSRGVVRRALSAKASGAYFVLACADAKRKVRESNERNNCRASARKVTVADPKTSAQLIEQALARGEISEEEALTYRVYAAFDESRLPQRFRGAPGVRLPDSPVLDEAALRWDELSNATRQLLEPFFIPPFNAGSWYARNGAGVARSAAPRRAIETPGGDLCANTAPDMAGWDSITAAGGAARVWWERSQASQEARAAAVAAALDEEIWATVTNLLRTPLPDGGGSAGKACRGSDDALDIALVPLAGAGGFEVPYYDSPDTCKGPNSSFVLVDRSLTGEQLQGTLAHEFAHAAQSAYAADHCLDDDSAWLAEATATWIETDLVYGGSLNSRVANLVGDFWYRPYLPLETYEDPFTGWARQYGAYVFFQWLAREVSPAAVVDIWEATESPGGNSVGNINAVLTQRSFSGGFESAWKDFVLTGLNPLGQADRLKQWDGHEIGAMMSLTENMEASATEDFEVRLPHLSAYYHLFTFDSEARQIEFTNPLAGVANASVQAWLKIREGGTVRHEIQDWSARGKEVFCRDIPAQNVEELVVVVANSATGRSHELAGTPELRTQASCAFDGISTVTISRPDGVTETYETTYRLDGVWSGPALGGGTESYLFTEHPGMTASWTIAGVDDQGCEHSGGTTWAAGTPGLQASLTLRDYGPGDPRSTYDHDISIPYRFVEVTRVCPDATHTDQYFVGTPQDAQNMPWDPSADGIDDFQQEQNSGVTIRWDWSLERG